MHPWLRRGIFFSHRDLCVHSPASRALSLTPAKPHSGTKFSTASSAGGRSTCTAPTPSINAGFALCLTLEQQVHRAWPLKRIASHGPPRTVSVHKMASSALRRARSAPPALPPHADLLRTYSMCLWLFSLLMTRSSCLNRSWSWSNATGLPLKTRRTSLP